TTYRPIIRQAWRIQSIGRLMEWLPPSRTHRPSPDAAGLPRGSYQRRYRATAGNERDRSWRSRWAARSAEIDEAIRVHTGRDKGQVRDVRIRIVTSVRAAALGRTIFSPLGSFRLEINLRSHGENICA